MPAKWSYLGLGLLDEASIVCTDGTWSAEYLDGPDPYLRVTATPDGCTIEEREADGTIAAVTDGTHLDSTIERHLHGALIDAGGTSRFWRRVAHRAPSVIIPWTFPGAGPAGRELNEVPDVGIGILRVPFPVGTAWVDPEPGPIASRNGFWPPTIPFGPWKAHLRRWWHGCSEPTDEEIAVAEFQLAGIAVPEVAAAIAARIPARGADWRPFLDAGLAREAAIGWTQSVEDQADSAGEGRLAACSIVVDEPLVPVSVDGGRSDKGGVAGLLGGRMYARGDARRIFAGLGKSSTLPALWSAADDSGRRLLTEAVFEKVEVLGVQSVTIHPTPEADAHGWSDAFGPVPLLLNAGRAFSTDGRGERHSPATTDLLITMRLAEPPEPFDWLRSA